MMSKPGFLPEVQKVTFGETGREMTVVMPTMQEYALGYVAVDSSVPGSRMVMYGRDTGDRTPVMYAGFPSGRREMSVVSPDGRSWVFTVTVVPGAVNKVFAVFRNSGEEVSQKKTNESFVRPHFTLNEGKRKLPPASSYILVSSFRIVSIVQNAGRIFLANPEVLFKDIREAEGSLIREGDRGGVGGYAAELYNRNAGKLVTAVGYI